MNIQVKCLCSDDRELTKFEKESLQDYYWNELEIDGGKSEINLEEWIKDIAWIEVDEIISYYTNEE